MSNIKFSGGNATVVLCVAIVGIVILESYNLFNGHNGLTLSLAVGAITTIVGFVFGKKSDGGNTMILPKLPSTTPPTPKPPDSNPN